MLTSKHKLIARADNPAHKVLQLLYLKRLLTVWCKNKTYWGGRGVGCFAQRHHDVCIAELHILNGIIYGCPSRGAQSFQGRV